MSITVTEFQKNLISPFYTKLKLLVKDRRDHVPKDLESSVQLNVGEKLIEKLINLKAIARRLDGLPPTFLSIR